MTDNDRPDKNAGPSEPSSDDATQAESPSAGSADAVPENGGAGDTGDNTPAAKSDKPRRSGRGTTAVAVLALLISLAAAGAVVVLGYFGDRRVASLDERVATAERAVETNMQDVVLPRVRDIESRVEDMASTVEQRGNAVTRLQDGLRDTRNQVTELADLVEGGRRQWQLLELEDLMLAANQRLQLHRDPAGARRALELVNRRLGKLNDPRLFDIRETVVDEIAALEALPDPDIEGLALSLSSMAERVRKLPLSSDVPDEYATDTGEVDSERSPGETAWRHFTDSVGEALDGMLTIRRSDGEYKPLMPPEQEFFLYQNLLLKLETARLALLERDAESYRASLGSAREWLQTFFDTDNKAVASAIEKLGQMRKVRIDWEAPDITGSVTALREFLDARGNAGSGGDDGGSESAGRGEDGSNGNE